MVNMKVRNLKFKYYLKLLFDVNWNVFYRSLLGDIFIYYFVYLDGIIKKKFVMSNLRCGCFLVDFVLYNLLWVCVWEKCLICFCVSILCLILCGVWELN